jgi:nucleoside triphosphate pyrophosphatase
VDRPRIVLASASPARRKLLAAANIDAAVMVSGVDESMVESDRAETLSLTLARMKANAVADRLRAGDRSTDPARSALPGGADGGDLLVLACDSVLAFDGEILGKPADAAEATRRWRAMRGGKGVLHTGHCLVSLATGRHAEASAATTVHFADLDDAEIDAYVRTGEPLEVAGAFTIDGIGGPFITALEGDHGTVVGLSLPTLPRLLAEHGIRLTDLWRASA